MSSATYTRSALDQMAREIRDDREAKGRGCPRLNCNRALRRRGWSLSVTGGYADLMFVWECSAGHVETASMALTGAEAIPW